MHGLKSVLLSRNKTKLFILKFWMLLFTNLLRVVINNLTRSIDMMLPENDRIFQMSVELLFSILWV